MWIVQLALRRPYTMVVLSLLILLLGVLSARRMPADIFPEMDLPVIAAVWQFGGLPPDEVEKRIVYVAERLYTVAVPNIEHIESVSLSGIAVIKIFLHPGTDIGSAMAATSAMSNFMLKELPPSQLPPEILIYSATDVPIIQVSLTSEVESDVTLNDLASNFVRPQFATVKGASIGLAYGGKPRQIMVDIDHEKLYAKGLSPQDVLNTLANQNIVLPSGTVKMGSKEWIVRFNSSPVKTETFNDLPIKQDGDATVYLRDVGHARDGYAVQTNIVQQNGKPAALLSIRKTGAVSTLAVIDGIKEKMDYVRSLLPETVQLKTLFDQSVFVRGALDGVLREAAIAAGLTALMILLFLGSWRSTLVIAVSIPLSILSSVVGMDFMGQTLNTMTLGGLALAVGILVDDSTVELENIDRHLGFGKTLENAILDGNQEIAVPSFVSTLCICIVFVPIFGLTGVIGSLFKPLAMAVIFAVLASYLLSRTVTPTLVNYLLRGVVARERREKEEREQAQIDDRPLPPAPRPGFFARFHHAFERGFLRFQNGYKGVLALGLRHRPAAVTLFLTFFLGSLSFFPFLGQDFFPKVDGGQIILHVRCPAGTRIEETNRVFGQVEATIREVIPAHDLVNILDNIGLPYSAINTALSTSSTIGANDGDIMISLAEDRRGNTFDYMRQLEVVLRERFPQVQFFYSPADMVTQILNLGASDPINIQVAGYDYEGNFRLAREIERRVARVQGTCDVHIAQQVNAPLLNVAVDRTKALDVGLTQRDVAISSLVALSSSAQVAPNYWLDWSNGIVYPLAAQTPQYLLNSVDSVLTTPLTRGVDGPAAQFLMNIAAHDRAITPVVANHYNIMPVFNVMADTANRDLGGVAADVRKIIAEIEATPGLVPRGTKISVRGQVQSMADAFEGLAAGLVFSVVLVYFLMVVNFQSWLNPFIILLALPGALAGIGWMLFITETTISVPALMGAIMCVGLTTANSILVINFANEKRAEGQDAISAAMLAGATRLRPVLMTTLAMILGMLPMSLGEGDGGSQNAPLGRAVIGGLLVAPFATLIFVPIMYSLLSPRQMPRREDPLAT